MEEGVGDGKGECEVSCPEPAQAWNEAAEKGCGTAALCSVGNRIYNLTASDLVNQIKSGQLAAVAGTMKRLIGVDNAEWARLEARDALWIFLSRYNSSNKPQYHFEHKWHGSRVVAILVTPVFFGRRFQSSPQLGTREAERSACLVFKDDRDVQKVRRVLPPTIQKIKIVFR